jgi:hypothetical protein
MTRDIRDEHAATLPSLALGTNCIAAVCHNLGAKERMLAVDDAVTAE